MANPKKLIVVEKDRRFLPALELLKQASEGRLEIFMDDMLNIKEEELLKDVTAVPWEEQAQVGLVGNLPFGIATELLLKWIRALHKREGMFKYGRVPMTLLFQKEVAERITSKHGNKVYGRLSVMVQHACDAQRCFDIPGKSFVPPPKVDATLVRVIPLVKPKVKVESIEYLERTCRMIFGQRRKMIGNSMKQLQGLSSEILKAAQVDPSLRPEQVSVEQLATLANCIKQFDDKALFSLFPKS
eukprot:TRINITY_DN9183_c0_g1_i1.p1 TRINITY_DN9183_c0_g1~~TRINITY_DN9183_c0_g1_i1.p1  ORF type:complete len:243 (+),score=40.25 TRINITY_DN9183_c0_g1_i1:309-1037(+)